MAWRREDGKRPTNRKTAALILTIALFGPAPTGRFWPLHDQNPVRTFILQGAPFSPAPCSCLFAFRAVSARFG
jgi:hypothetical protein